MKTLQILAAIAFCSIFSSCITTSYDNVAETDTRVSNIAVILDGTDRFTNSSAITMVSVEELTDLADKIAANGTGSLYVSFIDRDCRNNPFSLFEIWEQRPEKPGPKKEYVMKNAYDKVVQAYQTEDIEYQQRLTDALVLFSNSCEKITKAAYSDETASEKYGSDVYGAVNKALRAIASNEKAEISHIILISDCVHNARTEAMLAEIPESVELITVSSYESGNLEGLISKQFITFNQVINHLF